MKNYSYICRVKNKQMENKYYTPDLEEFCENFEYEIFEDFDCFPEKEWHKFSFTYNDVEKMNFPLPVTNRTRVKYLDKEDIEEVLGVKQLKGDDVELNFQLKEENSKNFYEINYNIEDKTLTVDRFNGSENVYNSYPIFQGKIKNKSELKKLLKQLDV
jgi:hypothetical protein